MILSLLCGTVTHLLLLLLLLRPCPSLPNIPSIHYPLSPPNFHHCFQSSVTSFVSLCPNTDTDTKKKNVTCNIITKIQLYLPTYLPTSYLSNFSSRSPPAGPATDARTHARTHAVITPMVDGTTITTLVTYPIPVRNSMTGPTFCLLSFLTLTSDTCCCTRK